MVTILIENLLGHQFLFKSVFLLSIFVLGHYDYFHNK
jgi:hypothetical protein